MLRWGATDNEVEWPYPGADLIPGGKRTATMAATIEAPPAQVSCGDRRPTDRPSVRSLAATNDAWIGASPEYRIGGPLCLSERRTKDHGEAAVAN